MTGIVIQLELGSADMDYFYAKEGIDLPRIELLAGGQLPVPQQPLLVNDRDMTSALVI